MKNDILVFYGLLIPLPDCVELTRVDEQQISRVNMVVCMIQRDEASPFFDIDELYFIMPVERDFREIVWNRAGISQVRKIPGLLISSFLIVFIFYNVHKNIL